MSSGKFKLIFNSGANASEGGRFVKYNAIKKTHSQILTREKTWFKLKAEELDNEEGEEKNGVFYWASNLISLLMKVGRLGLIFLRWLVDKVVSQPLWVLLVRF